MTPVNINEKEAGATNASFHANNTNVSDFPTVPVEGKAALVAVPTPDKAAIMTALKVLFDPDDVVELRALSKGGKRRTDSGYFDSEHWSNLAEHAVRLGNCGAAVYTTLNPVDPQLLGKYNNRVEISAPSTTTDKQIVKRRWLLIDLDPVRPTGTSATKEQVEVAKRKAKVVHAYLVGIGWPAPHTARSGNGFHLLYAIDLPNDEASTTLIKGVLAALGDRFDDPAVKVDRSVYNAARICKLYGTVANKGDHTPDTPWRLSKLYPTPERIVVTPDQLRQLLPPTHKHLGPIGDIASHLAGQFDLEGFLARHSIEFTVDQHDGRDRFKLANCPFNPEHVNGEAAMFRDPAGMLGFKCMHDSCGGKGWRDVRALLEGTVSGSINGSLGGLDGYAWPELQDLTTRVDPVAYPVTALPDVVRCAVQEVVGFVKAPVPLVATSALGALSLAIQAHADVERAAKLSGPTGLFLLAIADSGERKSTCDGFFTKAIREYESQQQVAAKPVLAGYKSDHDAWEAKRNGLRDKIKALSKSGQPTGAKEQELRTLDRTEPKAPRIPRMIYGDATPEALTYALAKQWPSAGVISSEAGSVFGGHGMGSDSVMRNLAALNQLWEGAALPVERRSSESFTVRGARLTMALQVQETTLRAFFANTKGLARGTGFLARVLVSWPPSTQGTREFTEAPATWPELATFNTRLSAILNRPVPIDFDGALTPAMQKLSPDAKDRWVTFHNSIEVQLSIGGALHDVRDVASKTADNAARLAALFHTFNGSIGPIDLDAMESGCAIAAWHLSEARRFFGELAMPAELANPTRLESWMLDYCKRENTDKVPTRDIQQFGPGGLRDKVTCTHALNELAELGRARIVMDGRKKLVQINPALLPPTVARVATVAVASAPDSKTYSVLETV
jgi:putative DNA primase/helicase